MKHAPDELESRLLELEATEKEMIEVGQRIMAAYGRRLYPFDFVAFASIKRSLALIAGFTNLIRAKNFICAAPIIRLHLDTALRFSAGAFVDDANKLANFILDGKRLSDFPASDGEKLTDRELLKRLAKANPWIKRVYKETSGYIHLSRKHISNTVRTGTAGEPQQIVMGKEDEIITDTERLEACAAMKAIMELVIHSLESWRISKDAGGPISGPRDPSLSAG